MLTVEESGIPEEESFPRHVFKVEFETREELKVIPNETDYLTNSQRDQQQLSQALGTVHLRTSEDELRQDTQLSTNADDDMIVSTAYREFTRTFPSILPTLNELDFEYIRLYPHRLLDANSTIFQDLEDFRIKAQDHLNSFRNALEECGVNEDEPFD